MTNQTVTYKARSDRKASGFYMERTYDGQTATVVGLFRNSATFAEVQFNDGTIWTVERNDLAA
jgi:hypothetical protein